MTKATEGSGFTDDQFGVFRSAAARNGLPFGAYHYVRSNASVGAQIARIRAVVPKSVSVSLDTEANSGSATLSRQIADALRNEGYRVPLTYLPRWYWSQIGSPSLAGLPPLWASRYPSMRVGSPGALYRAVPGSYWNAYGGQPVRMLQFTSTALIAGMQVDCSIYPGDSNSFAALLDGRGVSSPPPKPAPAKEKDMLLTDTWRDRQGNTQTVEETFNRINQLWFDFYGNANPSRAGDKNNTGLHDAIMDTVARVSGQPGSPITGIVGTLAKLTAAVQEMNARLDSLGAPAAHTLTASPAPADTPAAGQ